jgi:soluble lytic murein transglycosylase-like protein
MSAQAISDATTLPPDAAGALERVSAIQQMLAQAASGFQQTGATSASGSSAFSDLLASVASADTTSTTSAASAVSAAPASYQPLIDAAASEYGIDPAILTALIHQESGFDPNAVSSAGAEGLTQVMPENFAADGITNPFDPTQSIFGGAKQLGEDLQEFGGNVADALAAYNAGSGAVREYGGVPPYAQTQSYVQDILAYAQSIEQQQPASASYGSPAQAEASA